MRSTISIISLILVCCTIGWGQSDRGSITGTITDSTGGIVPDAAVTATNTATNLVSRTATNESGVYAIPALLPGTYKVRVEKNGFKAAEQAQVILAASSTVRVDIGLQVGEVSESVDVSASVAQLQTETAKITASVSNKMVDELPLVVGGAMRSPFDLALVTPEAKQVAGTGPGTDETFALGGGQDRKSVV